MKRQHKLLKVTLSTILALTMVFGVMVAGFAAGTPEIIVTPGTGDNAYVIAGSGFDAGQEVGILVLRPGTDSPDDIDMDNPISSIDYIDQVTATDGTFTLPFTSNTESGTLKFYTTDGGYEAFEVAPVSVEGNKISGKVTALAFNEEITVDLMKGDTVEKTMKANSDGTFAFEDVAAGTYSVKFSKQYYLTLTVTNIVVVDAEIDLGEKELLAGDVNKDGGINISDLTAVLRAWDTSLLDGDENYSEATDFNQDEVVNISDLTAILRNWDKENTIEEYLGN